MMGQGGRPGPYHSRIGRSLSALREVFDVQGGLGDPGELRTDAGVYLMYDVGRLMPPPSTVGPPATQQARLEDVYAGGTTTQPTVFETDRPIIINQVMMTKNNASAEGVYAWLIHHPVGATVGEAIAIAFGSWQGGGLDPVQFDASPRYGPRAESLYTQLPATIPQAHAVRWNVRNSTAVARTLDLRFSWYPL